VQGSILASPFSEAYLDWVGAIGCFHHTGDLQGALDESWRLLRDGGVAVVMVYNAYAYRRWLQAFPQTCQYWLWDKLGIGQPAAVSVSERVRYDRNKDGAEAPETVFISATQMRSLALKWNTVTIRRENIASEAPFRHMSRHKSCRVFGPLLGLDLYCVLRK